MYYRVEQLSWNCWILTFCHVLRCTNDGDYAPRQHASVHVGNRAFTASARSLPHHFPTAAHQHAFLYAFYLLVAVRSLIVNCGSSVLLTRIDHGTHCRNEHIIWDFVLGINTLTSHRFICLISLLSIYCLETAAGFLSFANLWRILFSFVRNFHIASEHARQ